MSDTTNTKALQLLGWYREGSFPALFTDSVSVVKQWMEQGHKVSGVIRHDGLAVEAVPGPSTTATPQERDWKAIDAAIDEYLDGYELRLDEGCHTPTEFERFLLSDAIGGLLAEREFLALLTPAPAAGDTQTGAARDVLAERQRQISDEGWTPEHDDEHSKGEIAYAATSYAVEAARLAGGMKPDPTRGPPFSWPPQWDTSWWKPSDTPRRNLVKAGALVLAEIERLDRAAQQGKGEAA